MTQTRLLGLDIARSLALLGMVAFHIVFDLQMFGHVPFGTTLHPFFYWHARLVAGSFLFLAGLSLWLAHGAGIRWPAFWRRWIRLAAAAALVTIATYAALPDYFVYFGILHSIAASSLIGLMVLRLHALAVAGLGAAIMAGSYILPDPAFNAPLLRFLGLATEPAMTVDFEPLFPWSVRSFWALPWASLPIATGSGPGSPCPTRPSCAAWPGPVSTAWRSIWCISPC